VFYLSSWGWGIGDICIFFPVEELGIFVFYLSSGRIGDFCILSFPIGIGDFCVLSFQLGNGEYLYFLFSRGIGDICIFFPAEELGIFVF
jgi:hypothetical protein